MIETRVLLPGQKLPPSRELAQRLKLARGAVVAAYEQLAADGFVEARLGAGTYVAAQVPPPGAAYEFGIGRTDVVWQSVQELR